MRINANSGKCLEMFQKNVITSNEVYFLYALRENCQLISSLINNKL